MLKTRRRWPTRLAALSMVVTGSLVALTPTAAFAASCSTWLATARKSVAICWDAPGGYQAWAQCWENDGVYWAFGPWKYNNGDYYQSISIAVCHEFATVGGYGVIV